MHIVKVKRLKVYGIIYYIKNKINGKYYIGQTTRTFKRRYSYKGEGIERVYKTLKADKKRGKCISEDLLNDIEQYGFDAFKVNEEYDFAFSREELDYKEELYINKFNSIENGYNFYHGGQKKRKTLDLDKRNKFKKASMKFLKELFEKAENGDEEAVKLVEKRNKNIKKAYTKSKEKFKELKKIIKNKDFDNELYKNEIERRIKISNSKKLKAEELKILAFEENDKNALKELKKMYKQSRQVKCKEDEKMFFSAVEAGRYYNLDPSSILKVCRGKNKTCGGFTWEYVD